MYPQSCSKNQVDVSGTKRQTERVEGCRHPLSAYYVPGTGINTFFNPQKSLLNITLLYKSENGGKERLRNLPKVTQLTGVPNMIGLKGRKEERRDAGKSSGNARLQASGLSLGSPVHTAQSITCLQTGLPPSR